MGERIAAVIYKGGAADVLLGKVICMARYGELIHFGLLLD